ncbi:MAG: TRAP transporter large permease [Desulfomonilaceae bacterium]
MSGLVGIIILMALMFLLEIPVGLAMGVVGVGGLWYLVTPEAAFNLLGTEIWTTFSQYGLSVIPLFVWMGQICFYSGVNENLYSTAYTWMGRTRGGLAMSTVMACAGFAAICGSNTATAATMTAVALPEMEKRNYDPKLSSASIAVGSTLGVVIPPSVVLLVYGIYTEQSISKLFWASTIPGVILTVLFCLTIYLMCIMKPAAGPGGPASSFIDKIKSLPGAFEMLFLFILVMVGLFFGLFTPTEAGAAGAFFALVMALIRKKLSLKGFILSLMDSLKVACMIIVIVTGAIIFGRFLTLSGLPSDITAFASSLPVQPWVIMSIILITYGIAGCMMDALGFLLVSIPIFFPLVVGMGYDPVWFGVILTVVTTMGAVTPPVGISGYVVSGMSKTIPLATVFKGILWFIPAYLAMIIFLIIFPQLALWLPSFVN